MVVVVIVVVVVVVVDVVVVVVVVVVVLNVKKWPDPPQFLTLLAWKCASRHNGVHFFDISTPESGPTLVCFVHFDLETCFAPQWRAIFLSHLDSWLRTRALARLLFDLRSPNLLEFIRKFQWIATFLPFRAAAYSCFPLFLFSDLLTS